MSDEESRQREAELEHQLKRKAMQRDCGFLRERIENLIALIEAEGPTPRARELLNRLLAACFRGGIASVKRRALVHDVEDVFEVAEEAIVLRALCRKELGACSSDEESIADSSSKPARQAQISLRLMLGVDEAERDEVRAELARFKGLPLDTVKDDLEAREQRAQEEARHKTLARAIRVVVHAQREPRPFFDGPVNAVRRHFLEDYPEHAINVRAAPDDLIRRCIDACRRGHPVAAAKKQSAPKQTKWDLLAQLCSKCGLGPVEARALKVACTSRLRK